VFVVRPMSDDRALRIFTAPEATNTGPGFNRGFGGGARGCGFGERVGAYARTEGGGHFLLPTMSVCNTQERKRL